jgi:ABC-2 type transport system ATP-binding protein
MSVLSVEQLCKTYGDVPAVTEVSFQVDRGEIVGLLGPNGAGKTTTISMVLGVLEPTSGKVLINGIDIAKSRSQALSNTNFAAVYASLPGNLTVFRDAKTKIAALLKEFDLERFADEKCGVLSSGEQTRASLAKAMINSPALLLLDEPTASLDPSTAKTIRERIVAYAKSGQGGVLWTSHNMQEVTEVCDRVLFVSKGKILLEGDPKTLPAQQGKKDLEELFIAVAREPLSLSNEL